MSLKMTQIAISSVPDSEFGQGGDTILGLGDDGAVYFYCPEGRSLIDGKGAWVPLNMSMGQIAEQPKSDDVRF